MAAKEGMTLIKNSTVIINRINELLSLCKIFIFLSSFFRFLIPLCILIF
ncbi:hypothetical protein ASZ90_008295 [hydrocarbon metagenome]|uniref:Uncharacterized protein n=1 Tax=hydrocarbon metagenome TaxID=938273 RepID=A0A0W8FM73_9ZZZZ